MNEKDMKFIFSSKGLIKCNEHLLDGLEKYYKEYIDTGDKVEKNESLASVFTTYSPFFKMYGQYCNDFDKIVTIIRNLKKNDKKVGTLINKLEFDHKKEGGKDLNSYLILPVQRVPRYSLLLRELIGCYQKKNQKEETT